MSLTSRQRRILRILEQWDPQYVWTDQIAYEMGNERPQTTGATLGGLCRRGLAVRVAPNVRLRRPEPGYGITDEGRRHLGR